MRQFLLIAKNWIKSIKRIKFAFSIFLVLVMVFSVSFTMFLESDKQIKQQTEVPAYQRNSDILTLSKTASAKKDFSEDSRFYQLFCHDYLEFEQKREIFLDQKEEAKLKTINRFEDIAKTTSRQGKKKEIKTIKRLPIFSFGGKDGCFQAIDWTKAKWDYIVEKDGGGRDKIRFVELDLGESNQVLRLNKASKFYQNSIHQRLLKKHESTGIESYAQSARELKAIFFPKILASITKEVLRRANQLDAVYLSQTTKAISLVDLITKLETEINLTSNFPNVTTDLKAYWNNMLLSTEERNKIISLLDDNVGLASFLAANIVESKNELTTFLQQVESWTEEQLPLSTKLNIDQSQESEYQEFANDLEIKIANNQKALLLDLIKNAKAEYWVQWLKEQAPTIESVNKSPQQTAKDNWLLAHITLIKDAITDKVTNTAMQLWSSLEKYEKQLKTVSNDKIKLTTFTSGQETLTINGLKTAIKAKTLSEATKNNLLKAVAQRSKILLQYLQIKKIFSQEARAEWTIISQWTDLKTIIAQTESTTLTHEYFLSQLKEITDQVAKIEDLKPTEIEPVYTKIEAFLQLINQIGSDLLFKINQAFKNNVDLKTTWNNSQRWKQNPIKINNDWKQIATLAQLTTQQNDPDLSKRLVTIVQLNQNNSGWNEAETSLQTFLKEISKSDYSLSFNSSVAQIQQWQKTNFMLKTILTKFVEYLFLTSLQDCVNDQCWIPIYVLLGYSRVFPKFGGVMIKDKKWTAQPNQLPNFQPFSNSAIVWPDSTVINQLLIQKKWGTLFNYLNLKRINQTQKFVGSSLENFSKKGKQLIDLAILFEMMHQAKIQISKSDPIWQNLGNVRQVSLDLQTWITNKKAAILTVIGQQKLTQNRENPKLQTTFNNLKAKGDNQITQILKWNQAWLQTQAKVDFYDTVAKTVQWKEKMTELKISENIVQLGKAWESNASAHANLKRELLNKIDDLITQGFNVHRQSDKLTFPIKGVEHNFIHLITPQQDVSNLKKQWTIASTSEWRSSMLKKNLYKNYWDELIEDSKPKKQLAPGLLVPGGISNFAYLESNWFNNIVWNDNLRYWKTTNLLSPIDKQEFEIFLRKVLALNGLKTSTFTFTRINEPKSNKKYLMVKPNDDLKIHLIAGRQPFFDNEILISPIFARNWNLKVGDKFDLLGLTNLSVVGIGVQKEFVYQTLGWTNIIPEKNEGVFYPSKQAYENIFWFKFKKAPRGNFLRRYEETIVTYQNNDPIAREGAIDNWKEMVGKESFTHQSLVNNNQEAILNANTKITDFTFSYPRIVKLTSRRSFPYIIGKGMLLLNKRILSYSTLVVAMVCLMVINFVIFYITKRKIDNNKKAIGVLQSLGIRTSKFMLGSAPIMLIIFGAVFAGWVIGVLLQVPIFNTLESFFNFSFKKYQFNFGYLFINFGIVFVVTILTILFFYFRNLAKLSIRNLMEDVTDSDGTGGIWLKNLLINKTRLNKYLFVKINYIFFSTVWKKILISVVIFFILTVVLTGNILFFTITKKTSLENYRSINHNYEVTYSQPISNNPFSRKRTIQNPGFSQILKKQKSAVSPLENEGLNIFIQDLKSNKLDNLKLETFEQILWFVLPVHWKSLNLSWLKEVLKQTDNSGEKAMCRVIIQLTSSFNVLQEKDNCLTEQASAFIPYKIDEPVKASNQVPFSMNGVQFDKSQDELFTRTRGWITDQENDAKFNIYGLNEQTTAFNFKPQTKKTVFVNAQINDQPLPVVVNERLLKKKNLQIGDEFNLKITINLTSFYSTKYKMQTIVDWDDWTYEDVYNHVPGCETSCTFDQIDNHVRFFNGVELNKRKDFSVTSDTIKYKNKPVKIMYRTPSGQYQPMLDITKVKLKVLDDDVVYPFLPTKGEKRELVGKQISWFARQIRDKKIKTNEFSILKKIRVKVVDAIKELHEPRLFMSQKVLNTKMSLPITKDPQTNQYHWFNGRFSTAIKEQDFIYNLPISTENGYSDVDIIEATENKNLFDGKKFHAPLIEKQLIERLTNYLLSLTIIFFANQLIMVVLFFIFIIVNIARAIRENGIKLKLFGYPTRIIVLQLLQMIMIPAIIGFVAGTIFVRWFLGYFLGYVSGIIQFDMFFDDRIFWSLLVLGFLLIILMMLLWKNRRQIKEASFEAIFQRI